MFISIRTKLLLYIIPVILIIAMILAAVVFVITMNTMQTEACKLSQEILRKQANKFDAELKSYRAVAQTIVDFMDAYKGKDRKEVSSFLYNTLISNPGALGTYVAFEPNAFDGKDKLFLKDSVSYFGRFGLYWNRIKGEPSVMAAFTPLSAEQNNWEWYDIPRANNAMTIMEPYLDEGVLMTSWIAPIHYGKTSVGVGGVDISLKKIDEEIGAFKAYDNGYMFLLSQSGVFMSFKDKEYIGTKTVTDFGKANKNKLYETFMDTIRKNTEGMFETTDPLLGKNTTVFYTSIPSTRWTLVMVVPTGEMYSTAYTLLLIFSLAGFISIILIIGSIWVFSSRLFKPIQEVATMMDQADLNITMAMHREDEIGRLTQSFDKFIGSVRNVLLELMEVMNTLMTSAKEISASTESISNEANNQTAQTSGAASAIEEMTRTIQQTAENAGNTKETTIQAQQTAQEAIHVIDSAVTGMNRIAESIKKSSDVIQVLSTSSLQIGKITEIITEFTKQTNLIALNASVEAVRAGDKGKGFAIVANEIQKLSERIGRSALEISELISKMQKNVMEVVSFMEDSRNDVDTGLSSVDRARNALQQIVDALQNLNKMISEIAIASNEQSSASEQVSENVKSVNAATQQIAGSIRQIAQAADYLNNLTDRLQTLTGYFKLDRK